MAKNSNTQVSDGLLNRVWSLITFDALEAPLRRDRIKRRVLNVTEVKTLLQNLTDSPHDVAAFFMLLTATRRDETVHAKWREIDFPAGEWRISGERRKDTREIRRRAQEPRPVHVVPLSEQALRLLKTLTVGVSDTLVFKGSRGRPLQNWSRWTQQFEKRTGLHVSPQVFRRTAATLIGDEGFPPYVIKAALGHRNVDDPLISGYNQSRYRNEVTEAFSALSTRLVKLRFDESKV